MIILRKKGFLAFGFWLSIVLLALFFGWVHVHQGLVALPAGGIALQTVIAPQTWAEIVFGYSYYRFGLEASMVAHGTTDLVSLIPFLAAARKHAHH